MKKLALFVVPHEDDLEILCFHAVYNLIQSGYKIIEVIMTDGRFGTDNLKAPPKKLKEIRKKEATCAANSFDNDKNGEPNIKIEFLDYCDGFLPLNKYSIKKIQNLIQKYKPDITLGMDPFFPIDMHHDHLNAGWNYYFALKKLVQSDKNLKPRAMYFLQSYKNDVCIPLGSFDAFEKALSCYKSQLSPLAVKLMKKGLKHILRLISAIKYGRPSSNLRRLTFNNSKNTITSFKDKMIYHLICLAGPRTTQREYDIQYKPLPKIGYENNEIRPEDFDSSVPEQLNKFYFGKKYLK